MSDNPHQADNLADEFRNLGNNLAKTMRAVWESPERKRLQEELEAGLNTLFDSLKTEADSFSKSDSGQRLKSDFDEFQTRVRSGVADAQLREEFLSVLRTANAELEKLAQRWQSGGSESGDPPEQEG